VDRRRLDTDRARSRFLPAQLDASRVDFSDRIPARYLTSYRASTKQRRKQGKHQGEDDGETASDSDELFDAKFARLRREVEELLAESEEPTNHGERSGDESEEADPAADLRKLSAMLDSVYSRKRSTGNGAERQYLKTVQRFNSIKQSEQEFQDASEKPQQSISIKDTISKQQQEHILNRTAEFEERITFLEQALGLNGPTSPNATDLKAKPMLKMLEQADRQISAISHTNPSNLDVVSRKVRQLTQEAERLNELRKQNGSGKADAESAIPDDGAREAKINALYGTIHTIEDVAPTLPLILERLRTLRMIHTSAAVANNTLDEIEKRQAAQEAEIKQWQEALDDLEEKLEEGEEVSTKNLQFVGKRVKDLEARIEKLS
jgi:nuclear migration protein JNM1